MFEPAEQKKDLSIHTSVVLRAADTKEDEVHSTGTLNIVEYSFGKCVEWRPVEVSVLSEIQDQDPEWSVVNHTRRSRCASEGPDSLGKTKIVQIPFTHLKSIYIHPSGQQLIFTQKDNTSYVAFFQLSNVESFVNSLKGFIRLGKSKRDRNTFTVLGEVETSLTRSFADLELFPESNTSDYFWGFMKNLHNHPYETALETFSKLTDILTYKDMPPEQIDGNPNPDAILRQAIETITNYPTTSSATGDEYEVIGDSGLVITLPPRTECQRQTPLTQEQWDSFKDPSGKITDPDAVKRIIFKGGISPSLRYEVWKFLLNYYPWNSTAVERIELRKKKTEEYYAMKLQWKTMTPSQEERFSEYRDRKTIIEKDVNRTDRTHPFYSGDGNPHLSQLYDILMTYVMYDFDLGYVQGMSDLLSPILCLMENEVDAFWCFVGFMAKMNRNFDMDQAGMKAQLCQIYHLLSVLEPQLAKYLDSQDSGDMFFCFRWILVLFKREFDAVDIMRLWEVLWTELPCKNFHLIFCTAVLDTQKRTLIDNHYGFTEIIKHINDLSLHIDLRETLSKAEGMYYQLMNVADQLPDTVRTIIGLEPLKKPGETNSINGSKNSTSNGIAEFAREAANVTIDNEEVSFERGLSLSYI